MSLDDSISADFALNRGGTSGVDPHDGDGALGCRMTDLFGVCRERVARVK